MLQDVMSCIREGCTIDDAGHRLERFADRHLRPPDEMARLFADYPEAIARTVEIAERCTFSLCELRYQYPNEIRAARRDRAAGAGTPHLGQRAQPLPGRRPRRRSNGNCATSCA